MKKRKYATCCQKSYNVERVEMVMEPTQSNFRIHTTHHKCFHISGRQSPTFLKARLRKLQRSWILNIFLENKEWGHKVIIEYPKRKEETKTLIPCLSQTRHSWVWEMGCRSQRVPLQSYNAVIPWPEWQSWFVNINFLPIIHQKRKMAPIIAINRSSLSHINLISLWNRTSRPGDQRNATNIWYLDFRKPFDSHS